MFINVFLREVIDVLFLMYLDKGNGKNILGLGNCFIIWWGSKEYFNKWWLSVVGGVV